MAVVFLIGGTGNQLFQFATSGPEDQISTLFLHNKVRQVLGWTHHEQVFCYPEARPWRQGVALLLALFDAAFHKIWRRTIFTTFDLRGLRAKATGVELVRIGYFQREPEQRSLEPLAFQLTPLAQKGTIVLHIRGGDLLKIERNGMNSYGLVPRDYYTQALALAEATSRSRGNLDLKIQIFTDDPEYAATFGIVDSKSLSVEIQNKGLLETFEDAVGAEWFISSNSTMSYWIIRLRDGRDSIAPSPFQKRHDLDLPTSTMRIEVKY